MVTRTSSQVLAILLLLSPAAPAQLLPQWLSIGAKAGAPTTSPTDIGSDASQWVQIGPSVEFKLPAGFAFEVDAIYQRVGYELKFFGPYPDANTTTITNYKTRGNDWQFPLLGKYYFRAPEKVQPYLAAGVVFGHTWNSNTVNSTSILSGTNMIQVSQSSSDFGRSDTGAVAAAGVRFKWGRVGILPEVRYTYWGGDAGVRQKNAVSLLMGFQF